MLPLTKPQHCGPRDRHRRPLRLQQSRYRWLQQRGTARHRDTQLLAIFSRLQRHKCRSCNLRSPDTQRMRSALEGANTRRVL